MFGDLSSQALKVNRKEKIFGYPLCGIFPSNCCEYVSLILIYLIEEKYGLDNAFIVRGRSERGDMHFWVMVGHLTYDITVQQFAGQKPLIGVLASEFLLDEFPEWEVVGANEFVDRTEVVGLYREGIIPF